MSSGVSSPEDDSVLVERGGRYVYFDNYFRTRESDKISHDTMNTHMS